MTVNIVRQLSIQEDATCRDIRNILASRGRPGALHEPLLTYWYPVPGSTLREFAFGYLANSEEPFVRHIIRQDLVGAGHVRLDRYCPAPTGHRDPAPIADDFLSAAGAAELLRQRVVNDSYAAHFPDTSGNWHATLPIVSYLRDLDVMPHLTLMPLAAVLTLEGQPLLARR